MMGGLRWGKRWWRLQKLGYNKAHRAKSVAQGAGRTDSIDYINAVSTQRYALCSMLSALYAMPSALCMAQRLQILCTSYKVEKTIKFEGQKDGLKTH